MPASAGTLGRSVARYPDGADNDSNCTDFKSARGAFIDPTPGTANFKVTVETPVDGGVGGTVPATLALTLGTPAAFAPFTPGVARTYTASTTANVISTAGDAAPERGRPELDGHRAPGQRLLLAAAGADRQGHQRRGDRQRRVRPDRVRKSSPATLLTYGGPISNDTVTVAFQQAIGATDALRTGSYSKTLTFTLSTTTP